VWPQNSIHNVFYLVESEDTGDFYLTFLRYYKEFSDPIIYEVKDIPLEAEPTLLSSWENSLMVQYAGANEVKQYLLCDFDEYIDIEENLCMPCGKEKFNWDPMSTSSSCIRCKELDAKWDYNQLTKYLAETICYDVANDISSGGFTPSECGALCDAETWKYIGIAAAVIILIWILFCIFTPVAATSRKRLGDSQEDKLLFVVI